MKKIIIVGLIGIIVIASVAIFVGCVEKEEATHSTTIPDSDGDGLSDYKEVEIGTNPNNADTDGDGYPDGKDDSPLDPDADKDGLLDGGDDDQDGLSNWFEKNIAHLDPLTANDRYAIILNTHTIHPNPYYTNQRREETINLKTFLIEEEKFEPGNVFLFMDKTATYANFENVIDYLAKTSDENDLVYIMLHGHGTENSFAFHSGKDPSEIEISDEYLEEVRKWYAWGYEEYWNEGGKEAARKDQQIIRAASEYAAMSDVINELIGKIKCKKMLFAVGSCGSGELVYKLSGENMVIIGRMGIGSISQKLILGIVSPDAIYRELEYQAEGHGYAINTLPENDDGNLYPSIKELYDAYLDDPNVVELIEQVGYDAEVVPKMLDPHGIATDLYFGEARIGEYKETDLYLLTPTWAWHDH
jgi:hypothetical protein